MTDEKIEKGWQCCGSVPIVDCLRCPYHHIDDCKKKLCNDTITYINRLKAEKAVGDRALELAIASTISDAFRTQKLVDNRKQIYIQQAKQELEKEKANAENKG